MTTWTSDELASIAAADELHVAPLRRNGTLHTPVPIWVVCHGGDLYVRSYRGPGGVWFRSARATRRGRIRAGGIEKDVTFTDETDPAVNDQIDAAYRAKYRRHSPTYVEPMAAPQARATTLKLMPR